MTYKEKWKADGHTMPNSGCPCDYGYEEPPEFSKHCASISCQECWNREIEEKENKPMKYQIGDTVLLQAKICLYDEKDSSYLIDFGCELREWVMQEHLFELPKQEKTYEQGLEDAWELAKKIAMEKSNGGFDSYEIVDIFGLNDMDAIFMSYTPQEALAKLKAYEAQTIKVGDVVEFTDGTKAIVMDTDTDDSLALFTENGCVEAWIKPENVKKTGKHIDIESLFEQIKGDANE